WWEEAFQIVNEDDFNKVDLSIRGQIPDHLFKQHIICLNPWADVHFINKRFFAQHPKNLEELKEKGLTIHHQDEDQLIMTTNYKVNEFLDKADLKVFDKMKVENPKRYAVEGVGDWGIADGLIFENWEEKSFDVDEIIRTKKVSKVWGSDFGYSLDPTTLACSLVDEGEGIIYIYDEHYQKGMTNRKIAEMIKHKGYEFEKIIADSAEPKSIDEIKHQGIRRMVGAKKGRDSIMTGIQFIQNFKIYIHPRCINAITEFSLYCWSEDKSGKKLMKPIDDYNHFIDAFRYSLEEFWVDRKMKIMKRPF
ncbi:MAG: PBSX family phage terminase large subunit, partial [Fusobacteriaceae bacterium]